jgi:hypothetical protein
VTVPHTNSDGATALTAIRRQLDATEGGPVVRESIRRHYEHLESLAGSLRKLGMDGREIDENIMQVFREYERELINYMSAA